jgi:raffinose/stachyose/melibiose transport system permease protein
MTALPAVTEPVRRAAATPPDRFGSRPLISERLQRFAMATPATAMLVVFMLVPIAMAAYLSFTDWDGLTPTPHRVGLANYHQLLHDSDVGHAALVTLVITVLGTLLCNGAGLGLALLLNGRSRSNAVLRAIVFYPYVVGPVIIGFLWSAILGANGVIANAMAGGGHDALPFLSDPTWAIGSITFVVVWSQFGVNVVLYLAGLQTVPPELLEAARVDGAGKWQTFRAVIWPILAPSVTINLVLVLVGLLRVYEIVLALTNGGPAGRTSTFAFLILADSFKNNKLGYGSAQAITLMVVIGAFALALTAMRRRAEQAVSA